MMFLKLDYIYEPSVLNLALGNRYLLAHRSNRLQARVSFRIPNGIEKPMWAIQSVEHSPKWYDQ